MRIKLVVKSFDSSNELEIQTVSAIKKSGSNSVSYRYIDEISKTFVEIFENSVIISREGEIESTMILKEGIYTSFDYSSKYMRTTFDLFTKKLVFLENGIEVRYILSQNGNFINELNLSILEK